MEIDGEHLYLDHEMRGNYELKKSPQNLEILSFFRCMQALFSQKNRFKSIDKIERDFLLVSRSNFDISFWVFQYYNIGYTTSNNEPRSLTGDTGGPIIQGPSGGPAIKGPPLLIVSQVEKYTRLVAKTCIYVYIYRGSYN